MFASLELLEHPESRAVVTGQQVGLLLGPTYTLSKAVTAINLAKRLSTEDRPVVPIFWLASQDHDAEEVNHTYLLDLDEHLHRLELPLPKGVPAGRIKLRGTWMGRILEELDRLSFIDAHRDETVALLQRAWKRAHTFADLFAAILCELLGNEGLILVNPLEPEVAPLFREVLAAELDAPLASSEAINGAAERLRAQGVTPQLGRGEGATNLFLEEDEERHLLRFDTRTFYTDTKTYSREALLDILETTPSRLTPAAGLRPITQDAALPTAVTVVGPGELRYFAQLEGVYERHGVAMPLIWPRATVTVLEPPVRRILDGFGITAERFQRAPVEVSRELLLELHGHAEAFEKGLGTIEGAIEELLEHVRAIDPTLLRTVSRGEGYLERTIQRLRTKSADALRRKDGTVTRQLGRLEAHLLPTGAPQERVLSPFSLFLKFGITPVLEAFLSLPPEGDHTVRF